MKWLHGKWTWRCIILAQMAKSTPTPDLLSLVVYLSKKVYPMSTSVSWFSSLRCFSECKSLLLWLFLFRVVYCFAVKKCSDIPHSFHISCLCIFLLCSFCCCEQPSVTGIWSAWWLNRHLFKTPFLNPSVFWMNSITIISPRQVTVLSTIWWH